MSFLLQTLGVLLAILVVARVLGGSGRRAIGRAAMLVAVTVAGALALVTLGPALLDMWDEREDVAAKTYTQRTLPAPETADLKFVEWLRLRIGPTLGERFVVLPRELRNPAFDPGSYLWLMWRLLPALAADRPEDADWVVFHRVTPRTLPGFSPPTVYGPNRALARRLR